MIEPSEIFDWIEKGGNTFTWKIPPSCPYFEGHFPGAPILPAVALIDGTVLALEKLTPRRWKGIESSKFMGPLVPNDEVELEIELKENKARCFWKKGQEKKAELVINLA